MSSRLAEKQRRRAEREARERQLAVRERRARRLQLVGAVALAAVILAGLAALTTLGGSGNGRLAAGSERAFGPRLLPPLVRWPGGRGAEHHRGRPELRVPDGVGGVVGADPRLPAVGRRAGLVHARADGARARGPRPRRHAEGHRPGRRLLVVLLTSSHPRRHRAVVADRSPRVHRPVCGMRVDRHQTQHRSQWHGRPVFFCSAGCKESFDADPDTYADELHGTLGWRPRGLLRERA